MSKVRKSSRRWHSIEFAILEHIGRYGLTTPAALVCKQVKGVGDQQQARHRLAALARRGDLKRLRLEKDDHCFLLTLQSADQLTRLGVEHTGIITNQAMLQRCYALLQLCCAEEEPLRALLPGELKRTLPTLKVTGRPSMICVSQSETAPLLIYLRVDNCGRGRWDRFASRAAADMQRLRSTPALAPFIQRGQLELQLITVFPEKAKRLDEVMKEKQQWLGVPCHIVAMPSLLQSVQAQPDETHSKIRFPAMREN